MQEYNPFFQSNKSSITLENAIEKCNSYDEFIGKYSDEFLNEDTRLGDFLWELLDKYNRKAHDVSVRAYLSDSYLGKIVNNQKKAQRDSLIAICLEIGTTVEELQYVLKYAGHSPLYVRSKRDVIIWYGLMKKEKVEEVDAILTSHGHKGLIDIKKI